MGPWPPTMTDPETALDLELSGRMAHSFRATIVVVATRVEARPIVRPVVVPRFITLK